ncbi:DUF1989 domain-containing protein [Goodfellowiella coeruleoviolacea]|uniref:DUF1989 domain-containing protein n=1 Tax=Goodfellowiella coeruleoviolacea TaxID=334858 RepID=A0AAE3KL96_9PSEU|nr:urea carboxylase-associated family protein [Goodfellowiella coeruleoviolacea]MCP2170119.1 hypothetical protein [Goodfellowiella coeruleoviolacea]
MQQTQPSEETPVPAGAAGAVEVRAGQRVRVVAVEGSQVADLFAFTRGDLAEHLSAAHTRGHVNRLFPRVGEQFVTTARRPILTLVEDTSPGRHDMLVPACDPARYRALGHVGAHRSCAENLREALAPWGDPGLVPQPVNLFMDISVASDGELVWGVSPAGPGAAVTLRAELDCVVVVSACPQDLNVINGGAPGPLLVEVVPAER